MARATEPPDARASTEILVWLEWPERCFRADAAALGHLRALASPQAAIVRVRSERAFLRALATATHALTWSFKADWFARAKRLRVLATPAAGKELLPQAAPEGVRLHFGGFHGRIIAESVAGFMLAWCRGFFAARNLGGDLPRGDGGLWPRTFLASRCRLLSGTQAVIVGYGRIGRAIGAKLEALGVTVRGFGRGNLADFPAAAKTADWLVLALPSTTGTDDFLSASRLRLLPRRCVVVNVGRGNAVDELALVAALRAGRLAGAYLDVIKREPTFLTLGTVPADDRARVPKILGGVPNLVTMPHVSACAAEYMGFFFEELKHEGLI